MALILLPKVLQIYNLLQAGRSGHHRPTHAVITLAVAFFYALIAFALYVRIITGSKKPGSGRKRHT